MADENAHNNIHFLMDGAKYDYVNMMTVMQENIAKDNANALSRKDNKHTLTNLITRYFINHQVTIIGDTSENVANRMYEDMAGAGFLSKYLNDLNKLEEININSWNSARVTMADGRQFYDEDGFLSPEHAETVISRLVSTYNGILDDANPSAKVSISKNTRMTVLKYPLVDKDVCISASIRTVNPQNFSEKMLINEGTATDEIIDFILFCISHGVSVCFAGEPCSGKTTTAAWLLSKIPDKVRIITLEHQTREFNLVKRDEKGRMVNDVVHCLTRLSNDSNLNYDLMELIKISKTMDPQIIVIGEIVGAEAFPAQIAARSGNRVITTTHSSSAQDTYSDLASMAKLHPNSSGFSDISLTALMVKAFPLIVYQKKLEDGTRRIMDVYEGIGVKDGDAYGQSIYSFNIYDNVTENGKIRVKGKHERVNGISKHLQRILLNNGANRSDVENYVG